MTAFTVWTVFLGGLASLAMACNDKVQNACAPTDIVIGAALDRTGTAATPSWASSIELAATQVNQALARSGSRTRFCVRFGDTQNDKSVAVLRAHELVAAGAKALILQQAPISLAVNKLNYDADSTNDLSVPLVCGNCVPPGFNNANAMDPDPVTQAALRDADEWFFRTVMSNVHDAAILVGIADATAKGDLNGDGLFKVDLYTTSDNSLTSFRTAIKTQVMAAGTMFGIPTSVETVVQFPFDAMVNTYDFGADLDRLTDSLNEDTGTQDGKPDVLIQLSSPDVEIAAVKAYLQRDLKTLYLHTINFRNPAVLSVLGALAEGQEGVSPAVLSDDASGMRFSADLQAATGALPAVEDANFYDAAVLVMFAVLEAAGDSGTQPELVTGRAVRAAMYTLNDPAGRHIGAGDDELATGVEMILGRAPINYDGASGPCDFTPTGNVTQEVVQFRVSAKRYVDTATWDCRNLADSSSCPEVQ